MMSHTLNVEITFTQPLRVVPWKKEADRQFDRAYIRGGMFAKWHMQNETIKSGRPYITGTMLRSALLLELEKIVAIHNTYNCCCREDQTTHGIEKPRKRASYEIKGNSLCKEDNPCPRCLLKGHYDKERGKEKKESLSRKVNCFTVQFENMNIKNDNLIWDQDVDPRIVNRVDSQTGKAKDFFTIHEIAPSVSGKFCGPITITRDNPDDIVKIKHLIAVGLAQIKTLAGSICRICIVSENHKQLIRDYFKPGDVNNNNNPGPDSSSSLSNSKKKTLRAIAFCTYLFKGNENKEKLRIAADAIRALRAEDQSIVKYLPRGKDGKDHIVWDLKSTNNITLRSILENIVITQQFTQAEWRFFTESLGQRFFEISKETNMRIPAPQRLLGSTEYFGKSMHIKESPKLRVKAPITKFIIIGELITETPFFFGGKTGSSQTSATLLLTRENRFRLPASVIRGILRRDLKLVIADGCNMPLGGMPCECPVCRIMNHVIVEDGVSSVDAPPEIRYRIRIDPHTGVVEEGALFDMETGFQGLVFPFRLHFETTSWSMDDDLKSVLSLWQSGQGIMGGKSGIGFGRFRLNLHFMQTWNKAKLLNHLLYRGYVGGNDYIPTGETLASYPTSQCQSEILQWEEIKLRLFIHSPLLSRDRIRAMLDNRKPDAVMFRKAVYRDGERVLKYRYAIKGEGFRGIIRNAIAKSLYGQQEKVYDIDHEECDCIQCRMFGSVHHQGRLRFEDLEITNFGLMERDENHDMKMDHVAIDRVSGGGVGQMKFDDYPLPGSGDDQLFLTGRIWVKKNIDQTSCEALCVALAQLRDGVLPLGGLGAIGYGRVQWLQLMKRPEWLQLPDESLKTIDFSDTHRVKWLPDTSAFTQPSLTTNKIYHPHTFLKPLEAKVVREHAAVSHMAEKEGGTPLWSGKLTCRLTTCGPVFIPDTNNDDYFNMQEDHPGHVNFGFFRINDDIAINGSAIRGMVSSVYEALTHSCFRVFDQKRHLTRSKKPNTEGYRLGKVTEEADGSFKLKKMDSRFFRLPLYGREDIIDQIDLNAYGHIQSAKIDAAMACNKKIAEAAQRNRKFLEDNFNNAEREAVLRGEKAIFFTHHRTHESYDKDNIAYLTKEMNSKGKKNSKAKKGYIKFTGPSMVNVKKVDSSSADALPDILKQKDATLWSIVNNCVHNQTAPRESQIEKYPRSISKFKDEIEKVFEYSILKGCETICAESDEDTHSIPIPNKVVKEYNTLKKENEKNTKNLPVGLRAWSSNAMLSHGDYVYFKLDSSGQVESITPVLVARAIDDKPMGKRFPSDNKSLNPCHHVCLEECDHCSIEERPEKECFSPHPFGLCPACHLFGTPSYKSRISFGVAWLTDKPKWYKEQGALTLPLLESPRMTWAMPDKEAKIPGRKFYIHHPWSVEKIDDIPPGKNNRTIEPLGQGNVFEFEVWFHNLRKWELGFLISALELEDTCAHKLGMGKALGLGSVQIRVSSMHRGNIDESKDRMDATDLKKNIIESAFEHFNTTIIENYKKQLLSLLWLPSGDDDTLNKLNVRYPTLEMEGGVPGYLDLKGNKYANINDRLTLLQTPWGNWHE